MSHATLDLRLLLAVNQAASKDKSRYYLRGVCVEIAPTCVTYCATDGLILLAAHDDADHADNDGRDCPNTALGSWIIPSDVIERFKLGRRAPSCVPLTFTKGELLRAKLEDDTGLTVSFDCVAGTFPDWRRIVPRDGAFEARPKERGATADPGFYSHEDNDAVQLDVALMARLCKAGEIADAPGPTFVMRADAPALARFSRDTLLGVIMPRRVKSDRGPTPYWTAKRLSDLIEDNAT